jgi:hypothetical protein
MHSLLKKKKKLTRAQLAVSFSDNGIFTDTLFIDNNDILKVYTIVNNRRPTIHVNLILIKAFNGRKI